jgi:D-3-phosphoglycerate dehydrogenase
MLAPEALMVIGPLMTTAETLGASATQLIRGQLTNIEIEYYGDIAEYDVQPLRAAIVRGLMKPISGQNINLVNASHIAQARGWKIEERLQPSHDVFTNLVHLRVGTTEEEVSVGGTLHHDGLPDIVSINGLDIDFVPEPHSSLIVLDNDDRPGMIGRVGSLLGQRDINISSMQVGRRERRGRALMLVAVDEVPGDDAIAAIEAIDGIYNVRVVRF